MEFIDVTESAYSNARYFKITIWEAHTLIHG